MKKSVKRPSPAAKPKAAPKTAKKSVPAKKKAAATESPATFISARIDVGLGNHLYLRGEGPGLSWDHGLAMDCVGADLWTSSIKNAKSPVTFKVLLNDTVWNSGNDYVVEPGQSITVVPSF